MKYTMASVVTMLAIIISGCVSTPPETAEQGWSKALTRSSVFGYEKYLQKHPNSSYEEQAQTELTKARQHQKEVIEEAASRAKEMKLKGEMTWALKNKDGKSIELYKGMPISQVEEMFGGYFYNPGMIGYRMEYNCFFTGLRWTFNRQGLLENIQ